MKHPLAVIAGIALVLLPAARDGRAAGAPQGADYCSVPPELMDDGPLLPALARHFRDKLPITIVAIGGASTAGMAAGGEEAKAYPRQLQETLRQHHPEIRINVINKGVAGQTTREMIDRFERDVYPARPTLVIWETGTVDAVHGSDVEAFATALQTGIAALRDHDAEVMLVDMQYNHNTISVIDFQPYLEALHRTADMEDVYTIRRFDMMRYWSENDIFNFSSVPKEQRIGLATKVYKCFAERMADAIEYAAR